MSHILDSNMPITPENVERQISQWLVSYLSGLLKLEKEQVDVEASFSRMGLDSSAAIGMTGDLSDWLGAEIDPAAAYDNPTIKELATALAKDNEILESIKSSVVAA